MKKCFILLLLLTGSIFTYAQLPNWNYKKDIYIQNIDTQNYIEQQVQISINTAALISQNKLKSDASDLRFTLADSNSMLPYWIESGLNTTSTKIWVRVPLISQSQQTELSMYYGNSIALSVANGDSTFDFFDGFNESSPDTTKWIFTKDPSVTTSNVNGNLVFKNNGSAILVSKQMSITAPFVMHTKVNGLSAYSYDLCPLGYANESTKFNRVNFFSGVAFRQGNGFTILGSPVSYLQTTPITTTSCDTLYDFVSTVYANGTADMKTPKGVLNISPNSWAVLNATRISLAYFYNSANAQGVCTDGRKYDHVFVTKYTTSSIVIDSIGVETSFIIPTAISKQNELTTIVQLYPNPVKDILYLNQSKQATLVVTLTDLSGRICMQQNLHLGENIIGLENYKAGVYFVLIRDSQSGLMSHYKLNKLD